MPLKNLIRITIIHQIAIFFKVSRGMYFIRYQAPDYAGGVLFSQLIGVAGIFFIYKAFTKLYFHVQSAIFYVPTPLHNHLVRRLC